MEYIGLTKEEVLQSIENGNKVYFEWTGLGLPVPRGEPARVIRVQKKGNTIICTLALPSFPEFKKTPSA